MIAFLCLKRVMEGARSTKGSTPMTVKRKIPPPLKCDKSKMVGPSIIRSGYDLRPLLKMKALV